MNLWVSQLTQLEEIIVRNQKTNQDLKDLSILGFETWDDALALQAHLVDDFRTRAGPPGRLLQQLLRPGDPESEPALAHHADMDFLAGLQPHDGWLRPRL